MLPYQAWKGASFGVLIAAILLWLSSIFDLLQNNVSFGNASAYLILGLGTTALISALVVISWVLLSPIPLIYIWATISFSYVIYYFFSFLPDLFGIIVIAIWMLIAFSLAGGALWLYISGISRSIKTITCLSIGIFGVMTLFFWLFFNFNTYQEHIDRQTQLVKNTLSIPNPSINGKFPVKELIYGSGTDMTRDKYGPKVSLKTKSVDGSAFIDGWDKLHGWLRTKYWGFDATKLPLNGHVFYPEGSGPFPLVMIVHGNHEMSAPSETGYAYLGKLWASRGFITVSVDENFLNGSQIDFLNGLTEAPARGWLLLEHLTLWKNWNQTENNPFYKKVDLEKIALIGHSRGGEAIATAASFNHLSRYPGNGNILFDYHFNIVALGAIAPVEATYTPGGFKIHLNDIDYFVIQGSHDGDLRAFLGMAQYRRMHFKNEKYHFKTALYIFGANHRQFNSIWGRLDTASPAGNLFDIGQLMREDQQQEIAKIYLTAFLEASLNHDMAYLPLFMNSYAGTNWLPSTISMNEFADSTYQYIIGEDNEKNIDLSKTAILGGSIKGINLSTWLQNQIYLKDGTPIHTGIFLGWNKDLTIKETPRYEISLPDDGIHTDRSTILSLSIADGSNQLDSNSPEIDFTIELVDRDGNKAQIPLSTYAKLQPASYSCLMKASFLDPLCKTDHLFQTFELPLSLFITKNNSLNPNAIKGINILFNISSQGLIILDNLAFHDADPKY